MCAMAWTRLICTAPKAFYTLVTGLGLDDITSAPRPRRKPSANLELVLWKTHAESTDPRNFSAVSWSSVTITSVWLEPYLGDSNMSNMLKWKWKCDLDLAS